MIGEMELVEGFSMLKYSLLQVEQNQLLICYFWPIICFMLKNISVRKKGPLAYTFNLWQRVIVPRT